jgi:hypothetical protein
MEQIGILCKEIKNINMKQLLSLFLFLLPCLALAQYPSNGNQKITLGEQTTADGLVYRGVLSDTGIITPSSDTSAYIILDTVNNRFFHYKRNTNVWNIAGGSDTSLIAYVNTYGTQTVNGAKTFSSTVTGARFNPTSSTASGTGMFLPLANTLGFSTNGTNKMTLDANGNLGIGVTPSAWSNFKAIQLVAGTSFVGFGTQGEFWTNSYFGGGNFKYYGNGRATRFACIDGKYIFYNTSNNTSGADATATFITLMTLDENGNLGISADSPTEKLHVVGNARITAVGTASSNNSALYVTDGGVLSTNSSDVNKKHNIRNLPYGLNTINQLNPVAFDWNENDITDIGFIAQDIESIIPESVITNWDSQLIFRQEKIVPILVKAIQEQNALIKALEQRIINLENK